MIAGRRWGVMWRVPWLRGGGQPQGRLLSSSRFGTDDDGGCKCGAQEQWTLRRALTFRGIGLHSGEPCTVTIRPAPVDHGITFETDAGTGASVTGRADRIGAAKVSARWTSVVDTTLWCADCVPACRRFSHRLLTRVNPAPCLVMRRLHR